jgi:hypothetical protein
MVLKFLTKRPLLIFPKLPPPLIFLIEISETLLRVILLLFMVKEPISSIHCIWRRLKMRVKQDI